MRLAYGAIKSGACQQCRLQALSEDGSVEGSTPLTVAMADRGEPRHRGRPRGPPGAPEPESPGSVRSEQAETARLFKGPPS